MLVSEFLNGMAKIYANCVSYTDEGFVKTKNLIAQTASTGKFRTMFKRGESFHFDWESVEIGKTLVFHSDSKGTVLTSSSGWTDESESLELGICSLFGATHGVAYIVPTLLLPSLVPENPRIGTLKDARFGQPDLDSAIRIEGRLHDHDLYQLWFRGHDSALYRCITSTTMTVNQHQSMIDEMRDVLVEDAIPVPAAQEISTTDEIIYEHVDIEVD